MSLENSVVIELGTPQGLDSGGLSPLASCVQRRVMAGQKVIAVVNAPAWRGERDVQASERLGSAADGHARAMLIGSGAIDTAERLAGTLADRGLRVARVDARLTAPVTRGHPLDAQPRHASVRAYAALLEEHDVIVVPAGVGVDDLSRATHLGDEAGALTALFLGETFGLPVTLSASLRGAGIGRRKARLFARDRGVEYALEDRVGLPGRDVKRLRPARREILHDAGGGRMAASA
ncbi:MAG: hypothetical protein ACF8Q5_06430 [Phycisphaerales bacterium JB040]